MILPELMAACKMLLLEGILDKLVYHLPKKIRKYKHLA